MPDTYIDAQDLIEETTSSLDGNEEFVMFDIEHGKRAKLSDISQYVGVNTQSDWNQTITTAKDYIKNKPVNVLLTYENIPNTVQSFVTVDGNVTQILHKRNGSAIRTDALTYGETTITEVRTLANGEKLTISTNLVTLETTITYTAS